MRLNIQLPDREQGPAAKKLLSIFEKVFVTLSRELGIADIDEELRLTFLPRGLLGIGVDGATEGRRSGKPLGPVRMGIVTQSAAEMIHVFAHEMVHVKQRVTKEMEHLPDGYICFHGQRLHDERGAGRDRIGEKEAYDRMSDLAIKAIDDLPEDDQAFVLLGVLLEGANA